MMSKVKSFLKILRTNSLAVLAILGSVLGLILVYNLIPYLIYLVKKFVYSKKKGSKQLNGSSPSDPWVRVTSFVPKEKNIFDECSTVTQLFQKASEKFRDKKCYAFREILSEEDEKQADGKVFKKLILSDYKWLTSGEINQKVDNISNGFLKIGIKSKDIVMIFGDTRLEWMISCQSVLRIGATVATLYSTLGEEAIIHGINETEVTHLITSEELINKLKFFLIKLPKIECIVIMNGRKDKQNTQLYGKGKAVRVFTLNNLEQLGKTSSKSKYTEPKADDTAVVMYTSGSTGVPKGVMISHKNFLSAVKSFNTIGHYMDDSDTYCAYLPLAHIMEMSMELFFIANGKPVGYANIQTLTDKSSALKKGIRSDTCLFKPTIMAAVPLVLDRISDAVKEELNKKDIFTKILVKILFNLKIFWFRKGFDTPLLNYIFCNKFRKLFGGNIRGFTVGGAPLQPETHDFIRGFFDIHVVQGYGLTETSSSATVMDPEDMSTGSVGLPQNGVQIKLIDWIEGNYKVTDEPNPRGEIVIGGDCVTKGYFKNEELTKESYKRVNGINWFYTGDIGQIDSKTGSFKIIDRKKDILKLSTGEYISLAKIEAVLKTNIFVANICVYAMSSKGYTIGLIVPKQKQLESLAQKLFKGPMSLSELCNDSDINRKVLESIQQTAKTSNLLKVETPNKIKLCSEEWLPENGLVTAALKLRRQNIQQFYQKDINHLYGL